MTKPESDNMESKDYTVIGERRVVDGRTLFSPGYYDDGVSFGTIFKDEKAFHEDRDAVCYIPEHAFDDLTPVVIDGKKFYDEGDTGGYTRAILEALISVDEGEVAYKDNDGEELNIDYFFQSLVWAYPETYLNEYN